jgi:hypothetical protein
VLASSKVTSKTVEFAFFWLPIIASCLLGGIAASAWYGGDKIPAIWIAFFGAVCVLLTVTIQAQQYTYANLLQPEINLTLPEQRSILTWNPATSFFINCRAEDKQPSDRDSSTSPIMIFTNASIMGQDASIVWELPQFDLKALVSSSTRLKNYDLNVGTNSIVIGPPLPIAAPAAMPIQYPIVFKQNVPPIAFLGKKVESWIPFEIWNVALIYFLATLPDNIGERSPALTFNATVNWNIPEGNKAARFAVTAFATNATTPNVETPKLTAYVSFTAKKLD